MGAGHGQVITEDHPVKLQLSTQDVLQPVAREAGRLRVDLRIDDVRRHHCRQLLAQTSKGQQVLGADFIQTALVIGDRHMGVGLGPAVPGKVLAGSGHAGAVHTADKRTGEQRRLFGVALESPAAHHRAALVIKVQYRGEAQVQPHRQHLGGHDPATLLGQVLGIRIVGQSTHGRQAHKALAQTLHPTALLVHGQQQVRANRPNRRAQLPHLARMFDIAGKDDQPTDLRLAQELAIFGRQPGTGDVHHQRALQASSHRNSLSTTMASRQR
ncbi:hypothetical protein BME99_10230 [Pseudomonas protegens]|nr:hypothetical protein BME99_10230 [Pseudomonas protegens]